MAYKKEFISFTETKDLIEQIKSRKDIWISKELCDKVLSGLKQK